MVSLTPMPGISTNPVTAQPTMAPRVFSPYSSATESEILSLLTTKYRQNSGNVAPIRIVGGRISTVTRAIRVNDNRARLPMKEG